jgi:hypothetical protein
MHQSFRQLMPDGLSIAFPDSWNSDINGCQASFAQPHPAPLSRTRIFIEALTCKHSRSGEPSFVFAEIAKWLGNRDRMTFLVSALELSRYSISRSGWAISGAGRTLSSLDQWISILWHMGYSKIGVNFSRHIPVLPAVATRLAQPAK